MHPLQGASFLGTPLQGGILKPPALRVVDDCSKTTGTPYDDGQVIKHGTYASTAQRAGP